ncbi:thiamine phosphate synthase [Caulobacter mirabilis]|uniref:Thiamine monophosphate synthase n=1 Tax=Caulobacter mirabilis TaxID=69666 RepID=A0A2D2ASL0_9CAUL|nr:thiamine phosphate synthase [Caulobacter mirabilis]ATQ40976.1 thiamine monophosphate synthase [Caulobacter mirabilis]
MSEATDDLQRLADLAASLRPRVAPRKPLPRLLFVTDPDRTPDPAAVAERLPAGWGVIYRAFGRLDAVEVGLRLRRTTRARGLPLLVGADADLARACEADGLHLPERLIGEAAGHPGWIVTAAAHSTEAVARAADAGCDAVLVSPVFPSRSPSAASPMGAEAFAALVAASPLPVYALGGVNTKTAPELVGSGAAGFAMVEAVRT